MNPFKWLLERIGLVSKEDIPFGGEDGTLPAASRIIEQPQSGASLEDLQGQSVPLFAASRVPKQEPDPRRPEEEVWQALRQRVFEADGWRCQVTGCINSGGPLECHHIEPVSKGGSNEVSNLITLCLFHHACQEDHDLRSMKERADNSRFYITPSYWQKGKLQPGRIGRKRLVTVEDLKLAKTIYDLQCRCGSRDWKGFIRPTLNELVVLCSSCDRGWKLPMGIHEETCVALAHLLCPAANHGRFSINDLGAGLAGLRINATSVRPCPYCFLEDHKCGYLVPYVGLKGRALRCVNASKPRIQCHYRASI